MQLGFIGLGVMGRPMALHLLRAGHRWRSGRAGRHRAAAARSRCVSCGSRPRSARRSRGGVHHLTAGADVERVTFGPDGLAEGFAAARCWST
jgi:2-hydroxy-3-oxopropionate reductase